MKSVGIRELKNRLSAYLRLVRKGESILVTDRGEVVAELRPGAGESTTPHAALRRAAREGRLRLGGPNRPDLYPRLGRVVDDGDAARLLDESRGER